MHGLLWIKELGEQGRSTTYLEFNYDAPLRWMEEGDGFTLVNRLSREERLKGLDGFADSLSKYVISFEISRIALAQRSRECLKGSAIQLHPLLREHPWLVRVSVDRSRLG